MVAKRHGNRHKAGFNGFPPDNDPHRDPQAAAAADPNVSPTPTPSCTLHSVTPDTRHSCQAQFKKLINMPNSHSHQSASPEGGMQRGGARWPLCLTPCTHIHTPPHAHTISSSGNHIIAFRGEGVSLTQLEW